MTGMKLAARAKLLAMTKTPPSTLASTDMAALGRRIRNLRAARGMTQAQVVGNEMSVAYLSRIEAGQRRPDVRLLEVIARRLDTAVEDLLGQPPPPDNEAVELDIRLAELALSSGDASEASAWFGALLDDRTTTLPPQLRCRALWALARAREASGDYAGAVRLLEQIASAAAGPHPAIVDVALSRCYRESGDLNRAVEVARRAEATLGERGLADSAEAVHLLVTMAAAYHERGDLVVAHNLCVEAIERAERGAEPTARASAYWNASIIARRAGDPGALSLAERALAILSELEDARHLAQMRLQIGILLVSSTEPDLARAERELQHARTGLIQSNAPAASLARCDSTTALVFLAHGDLDAAWETAVRGRDTAVGAPLALAHAEAVLGRIALARQQRLDGRRHFSAAVAALTGVAADREAAQLWVELGALLDEAGETEAARDAYRSAAAASGLRLPASTLDVAVH